MNASTVTSKGQMVVPAAIRRRYGITGGTRILFVEREGEIVMLPVTKERIRSLHGALAADGPATAELLRERSLDRKREHDRGTGAKRRPR